MKRAREHGGMGARAGARTGAARLAGGLFCMWLIGLIGPIGPIQPGSAGQRTVEGIHVWTDRSVDFFNRDTILKSILKPDMTDEEKAVACYELVRTRVYHFCRPDDNDPMRVLNVYGYALCGTIQHTLVWLAQGTFGPEGGRPAGLRSRRIANPKTFRIAAGGWLNDSLHRLDGARPPAKLGHSWCQLFYDGRYHYMDAHAGFYVYTADGKHIASLEEISGDPTLVTDPVKTGDPFMPCDDGRPEFFYRCAGGHRGKPIEKTTHSMALRVRPGETLAFHFDKLPGGHFKRSRSWKGQWSPDYYKEGPHLRSQGEKVKSYRHYGNGEIIFEPDLSQAGFKESLAASENLACRADDGKPGLHPKDPDKPASATFGFKTPYPMVAGEVRAEVTTGGLPRGVLPLARFIPPGRKAKPQLLGGPTDGVITGKLDMYKAYYPYSAQVRVELPAGCSLTKFRIRFVTQLNFHTLPRPLPGANKVFFECTEGSPKQSGLRIEWAWTEAGAKKRSDARLVGGRKFEYDLILGEVNVKPARNPKHMRWLKLSVPDPTRPSARK